MAEKEWERGNEKMGNKEQESSDIGYRHAQNRSYGTGEAS